MTDAAPTATGVRGALLATAGVAAVAVVAAAALDGADAARGVALGAGVVAILLALGTGVTHAVAALAPALSLVVAMLTYLLQLAALVAVLAALERSDLLVSTLDRTWTGATIIVATLVWSAALVHAALRRAPLYHSGDGNDQSEAMGGPGGGAAG